MRGVGVRRLPVVDGSERLLAVLSLTDFAGGAARQPGSKKAETTVNEIGELLASICGRSRTKRAGRSHTAEGLIEVATEGLIKFDE